MRNRTLIADFFVDGNALAFLIWLFTSKWTHLVIGTFFFAGGYSDKDLTIALASIGPYAIFLFLHFMPKKWRSNLQDFRDDVI